MATSVGSLPRPSWLAATDRSRASFRLEGDALREAQDDATILALREQEEIGLDVLTDGEQRRESFVYHAARTWDGVDWSSSAKRRCIATAGVRACPAHHRQGEAPRTRGRGGVAFRQGAYAAAREGRGRRAR